MRIRTVTLSLASTLTLFICISAALAQEKPNFSGTWKLNPAKSDLAGQPPYSAIVRIDHKEPRITSTYKVNIRGREIEETINFTTDGSETKNKTSDAEMTYKARWEGLVMIREAKGKMSNGVSLTRQDRWTLSKDGKELTMRRHSSTDNAEEEVRFVLEKQ
jgi:hypothetical protein